MYGEMLLIQEGCPVTIAAGFLSSSFCLRWASNL